MPSWRVRRAMPSARPDRDWAKRQARRGAEEVSRPRPIGWRKPPGLPRLGSRVRIPSPAPDRCRPTLSATLRIAQRPHCRSLWRVRLGGFAAKSLSEWRSLSEAWGLVDLPYKSFRYKIQLACARWEAGKSACRSPAAVRHDWGWLRYVVRTSYPLRAPHPQLRGPSILHSRPQTFLQQVRCDPFGMPNCSNASAHPARGTAKAFASRFGTSPDCSATSSAVTIEPSSTTPCPDHAGPVKGVATSAPMSFVATMVDFGFVGL